jgi:hypothetical protein
VAECKRGASVNLVSNADKLLARRDAPGKKIKDQICLIFVCMGIDEARWQQQKYLRVVLHTYMHRYVKLGNEQNSTNRDHLVVESLVVYLK